MKDYSYSEIGMLVGAGVGGCIAFVGFTLTKNTLIFSIALVGIALGMYIGDSFDKKTERKNTGDL